MESTSVSFWRNRNVFVTGATGLLGSWLVEELNRRGASAVCLVRDWVPRSRLVQSGLADACICVRGELEDFQLLLRIMNEYEIDSVFHLGAQTIVGTAVRSPLSTFDANIRGTWNLLEACRVCPQLVERIVVASSDKAYGAQTNLPYTESAPLLGGFPYDVSKACADLIAFSYHQSYRLPIAVTRCGNLFGGGDLNFNRLIPGTIRSALLRERPIVRSDGKFVRDYFFVRDAVHAYLTLAERLPEFAGHAFNFSTETPLSVIELVKLILEVTGAPHLAPRILNQASHEIPEQYLECGKARQLLGWNPNHTLREALEETVDWYRGYLAETSSLETGLATELAGGTAAKVQPRPGGAGTAASFADVV